MIIVAKSAESPYTYDTEIQGQPYLWAPGVTEGPRGSAVLRGSCGHPEGPAVGVERGVASQRDLSVSNGAHRCWTQKHDSEAKGQDNESFLYWQKKGQYTGSSVG